MRKQRQDVTSVRTGTSHSSSPSACARVIWLLLSACILVAAQMPAAGQTLLPGLRAPLLDTPATPSNFRNSLDDDSSGGLDANDAEIEELARGLRYDPGLMYKFVHDHIRFTPIWGQVKGPYMTWMDRSGNAFDQASLMIALLEHAAEDGTDYVIEDPKFMVGEIQLSAAEAISWLRVPDDVELAEKMLARSGFYATVSDAGDGTIGTVNLEHVWVAVTVDGNDYQFDPSFKSHTTISPPQELLSLYAVMGYLKTEFMDDATEGMSSGTGYIKDVNTVNIAENLKEYSTELIESIKSYASSADLKGVLGGFSIDAVEESEMYPSSLPYTVVSEDDEFEFANIPDMYRPTLRIQHAGIDATFFSSDIYGRRLTLQYNGSNQPQLVLDGAVQATGSSTTPGQAYDLTFTVDHPYDSSSFDEATTVKVVSGGFYQIVNGWADTGTAILRKHRDLLEEYRYDSYADTSEQVLGESYSLIGLTWLAQVSQMRSMTAQVTSSAVVNHHLVGVAGQTESGGAPYLDVPLGCLGITAKLPIFRNDKGVFLAIAGHASAYEYEVIREFQDCDAVSTVKVFEAANEEPTYGKIYQATSTNWTNTVQPALHNYSQAVKDQISAYITAGFTVYLPEKGDLLVDDWTGTGFQALLFDANGMTAGYLLSGGYSGGASAADSAVNPAEVFENCYGAESGRGGDGAYGFGNTDLSIGDGGYPFGLSFGRQYSSRRRFEDGPLGLGWTHNLDMQALVKTDTFQFLGNDSPIDAAPHIVSLYVTSSLPDSAIHWHERDITASLCTTWLMDQMTDEVVVIKQGSGTTTFVKDPNGTYNPPPGASLKLTTLPNGAFRLKNSSGIFNDFDPNGYISQWSDAHGNEVNFTYTSGKLTQVANEIGGTVVRWINFTYSGDRITSVSDSAGRSVSYEYDAIGQLTTFTNLDGNDVTYGYADDKDGLMDEIYSPVDPNNPVLTVVYDSLDRMMRQIDANDCAWDYYLATYRSEVVEPNQADTSDPNDPNAPPKRFSTIRWANPETRKTITKDHLGRETVSAYDGQFRTTSVLGASGMSTQLDYDQNNNVTGVTSVAIPGSDVNDITVSSDYHDFEDPVTGRWFIDVNETRNIMDLVTKYEYDYDPDYPSEPNVGNVMRIIYPDVQTPNGTESRIVQFSYYSDGRIHTQTDPNGMVTHYEYYTPAQGGGLKEVVVDANGLDLTTQYTYDSVGRVISVTDPRGNTAQTEYFDSGLVRKTIAPSPFEYETVYEYYKDGKLKHVKQIVPGSGGGSGNNFGSDPHCVALWNLESGALTVDSIGSNTLTNSGVTASSTYKQGAYSGDFEKNDSDQMLISDANLDSGFPLKSGDTNRKISIAAWIKPESIVSAYVLGKYDATNNKRSLGVLINPSGQIGLITGHNGGTTYQITYSTASISAGSWYHIAGTYDDSNRSWKLIVWSESSSSIIINMSGTKTSSINVEDAAWVIGNTDNNTGWFDGLIDEVVVFNDVLTADEIDEIRQGTYGASAAENVVYLQSITYNNRGQKETVRGPYPEDATATELQVNYTQYSYDALGRPWKVTDAENHVTETRYYPDGKVWKVIDAKGNDAITKTYNADGSLQKVADAKGNETHYEYNGAMKLEKTTFEDNTYEELDYDAYRRLTGKTTRIGQTIEITYDDFGRVESKEITDANNPVNPSNTVSYAYDRLGRVVEMTDDTGTITYSYDSVGRLTDVNYPGGKIVSYQYDAAGNRTRLTYPDASYIIYEYDALNRLTAVRNDASQVLAEYTFDARSRRTGLAYANGAGIDYSYDTASRLLDVNNVTDTGQLKYAYSYDDVGNRLSMSVTDSSGTKIHLYDYDNIYQLTDVNYPEDFDYLATDTTFNYDEVGNRTSVVDDAGTVNYTANALNQYADVADVNYVYDDNGNMIFDGRYEYSYDAENRLIQVNNVQGDSLAAACDSDLSFTTGGDAEWFAQSAEYYADNDAAQSGVIDVNEETWMQTTVIGPGNVSFYYKMSSVSGDALAFYVDEGVVATWSQGSTWPWTGNISVPAGPHTLKWKYYKYSGSTEGSCWVDAIQWSGGAPESGGGADWEQITYTYDPSGRRIAKDVDGEVTRYVYDGDQCIAEYDANDVLLRKYIHGPCIDQPICMIEVQDANAAYFYHYDGLGSVVALSDADGDTVQVYEYDVYGQVAASDPNHPNRFMFTGREFDSETGLYYYRARYYNPAIGRFLQTDPIGYGAGMNLHRYCQNNPWNMVDPYGTDPSDKPFYAYVWDGEQMWRLTGEWNLNGVAYHFGVDLPGVQPVASLPGLICIVKDSPSEEHNGPAPMGDYEKVGLTIADLAQGGGLTGLGTDDGYDGRTPPAFGGLPGYEDLWAPEPFKEVYPDIYASGRVPSGWRPNPGSSPEPVSIHDPDLKQALRATRPGKWRKMYWKGTLDGRPCEVHYCKHVRTGVVVDVELVWK